MNKKVNSDPVGTIFNLMSNAIDDIKKASNLFDSKVSSAMNLYVPSTTIGGWVPGDYPNPLSPSPWSPTITTPNTLPGNSYSYFLDYSYGSYPKIDVRESHYWKEENGCILDGDGGKAGDGISWCVEIYVPGLNKDDIEIELTEAATKGAIGTLPALTVKTSKQVIKDKDTVAGNYFHHETSFQQAMRVVSLPADADIHKTTEAELKDGVLKFFIKKTTADEPVKNKKVTIK